MPKGRPVKRTRGATSGNQAYLLGLLEQGIESIGNHAKEVDQRLNDIQEIKRDVQAIHSVILMRQDSNLGNIVIQLYKKVTLNLNEDQRKHSDRHLINAILAFEY